MNHALQTLSIAHGNYLLILRAFSPNPCDDDRNGNVRQFRRGSARGFRVSRESHQTLWSQRNSVQLEYDVREECCANAVPLQWRNYYETRIALEVERRQQAIYEKKAEEPDWMDDPIRLEYISFKVRQLKKTYLEKV